MEKEKHNQSTFDSLKKIFDQIVREIESVEQRLTPRSKLDTVIKSYKDSNTAIIQVNEAIPEHKLKATEMLEAVNTISLAITRLFENRENGLKNIAKLKSTEFLNTTDLEEAIKELKKSKRRLKSDESAIFDHNKRISLFTETNNEVMFQVDNIKAVTEDDLLKVLEKGKRILVEKQAWEEQNPIPNYDSDSESCYSNISEIDNDNDFLAVPTKKILQIALSERDGAIEEKILAPLGVQKSFNESRGFAQKDIVISLENLTNPTNYSKKLENLIGWVTNSEEFIIQINDDGIPIDKEAAHDAKNVIEVLTSHGLNEQDYQYKGKISLESCNTGQWSTQRAVNSLKKKNVGGLSVEGPNHEMMIKIGSIENDQGQRRSSLKTGKYGEALVVFGNNRYDRADAKDFNNDFKYKNLIKLEAKSNAAKTEKRKNTARKRLIDTNPKVERIQTKQRKI